MDAGFSKKFTDGVLLVGEEEAQHMRDCSKCGSLYHEVKKGAVLPPRPPSLDPTVVRHPSEMPQQTPEQEFKEVFGATTEEFEPPAQHIHVDMTGDEVAPEAEPETAPVASAPAARQPMRKATMSKENTDVPTQ
jgi:hypothetical protein